MKKLSLTFITSVAALLVLSVIVWQNYEKGLTDMPVPSKPITYWHSPVDTIALVGVAHEACINADAATYGAAGKCNISKNNDADTAWLYNHSHILGQGD